MRELQIFLERKARDPSSIVIIPVFYELTVEQCENLEQLYASEPWPTSPGVPKVEDKAALKRWAEAVNQLLGVTGAKIEEVSVVGSSLDDGVCGRQVRLGCADWLHKVQPTAQRSS
jgi:hypothetical protein